MLHRVFHVIGLMSVFYELQNLAPLNEQLFPPVCILSSFVPGDSKINVGEQTAFSCHCGFRSVHTWKAQDLIFLPAEVAENVVFFLPTVSNVLLFF